jgi:TPR repeat protein
MTFRLLAGYILLLLLFSTSLPADDALEKGVNAFRTDDFETARRYWAPLAEDGHAEAQLFMGVLYRHGLGVDEDPVKSAYWYERAANNGNVDAQGHIGFLYELGLGVKQDIWMAASWYEMVLDRDICLSDTLAHGRLVVRDELQ